MPFTFTPTELKDVIVVEPAAFPDDRGFFMETYKRSAFAEAGMPEFVQDNYSRSSRDVLRGLHYQKDPHAQGKLVGVISGAILDVAVDIRKGSPTYGDWVGVELTAENRKRLYVPPGFAHGFYVESDWADVMYKTTAEYAPEVDRGIAWNDPAIGVVWPTDDPDLSDKDRDHPLLDDADNNFVYVA